VHLTSDIMTKALTAAACIKYRKGSKRRRIRDGGIRSLFLVIEPSGHKSWQMRFRTPTGRIGKMTLGPFYSGKETEGPPVIGMPLTLAAARQLATEVHRQRALGGDPIAQHAARKHRQRTELEQRSATSFGTCARDFIAEYAKPNTRRWFETARLLGLQPDERLEAIPGGLAQRWADRPVHNIDGHDIWSVTDEARRVGVPGISPRSPGKSEVRPRALFAALSALFGWLQRHRKIQQNPCAGLHRPPAPRARERVLSADEIQWFWRACHELGEPFSSIFRLLLLTGQRLNEVAGMRRDELHEDGTWHLPGSRTKNGRAHVVPLPPLARELIASVQGKSGLLFSTTGTSPPSGWSRAKRRLDAIMAHQRRTAKATIPPWRLHDLRRTAVTGMAELSIRSDVIELVVNHVSGHRTGVAGTYNRSELLDERRQALERWSAHIGGLVTGRPTTILPLRA
jgi:integrase